MNPGSQEQSLRFQIQNSLPSPHGTAYNAGHTHSTAHMGPHVIAITNLKINVRHSLRDTLAHMSWQWFSMIWNYDHISFLRGLIMWDKFIRVHFLHNHLIWLSKDSILYRTPTGAFSFKDFDWSEWIGMFVSGIICCCDFVSRNHIAIN